jgi:hypothetical protein
MAEVDTGHDTTTETGFDMDAAADKIGASLFPEHETPETTLADDLTPEPSPPLVAATPAVPIGRQVPKSWPKEMHEHWGNTDPKVQEYWETREQQMQTGLDQYKTEAQLAKTFEQILHPFAPILKSQGVDAPQAVQYLLTAHQRLTQGTPDARRAAYDELGRSLGFQQTATPQTEQAPIDPALYSLQQQMAQIQSTLTARQQADYQAAQARTSQEVEQFASDPTHPHFNEVADDIVLLLKTGLPLQEAYDKAVWANPLTREQQLQARLTSETEKQKENARLQALPKAKAARNNIRSLESKRGPSEPLGTMADTLRETLKEIRARAS